MFFFVKYFIFFKTEFYHFCLTFCGQHITYRLRMPEDSTPVALAVNFDSVIPCIVFMQKELADEFIANYKLNHDQGTALQKVADMMNKESASLQPMLLVHGKYRWTLFLEVSFR